MVCKFPLRYTVLIVLILLSDSRANFESVCDLGKCVAKCCPGNAYIHVNKTRNVCVSSELKADFSDVDVYDNNLIRTGSVNDSFIIVDGKLYDTVIDVAQIFSINAYVLQNGNLQLKLTLPNAFVRWKVINNDRFCVDYMRDGNDTFKPVYSMVWEESAVKNVYYSIAALIISCIFLSLVLIVYLLLKNITLKRKILMSIVLSLFGAFGLLATHQIRRISEDDEPTEEECYGFTCSIYFFFLAAFCWMNVMSFDIWRNLRSIMSRTIRVHRRRKNRKFVFYCIYAWGVPAVMAVTLRLIDQSDLSEKPWIIKPNINVGGCFISGKEKLVYLYIPMMILILSNWILFLMTAFNLWRTKLDVKVSKTNDSNNYLNQKQRFLVYLRLSIIMGLSFVLEVISSFNPDFPFWYITDAYNMFIGVVIFITFVCKKSILKQLSRRLKRMRADDNSDTD